jgi:hypothetical protein
VTGSNNAAHAVKISAKRSCDVVDATQCVLDVGIGINGASLLRSRALQRSRDFVQRSCNVVQLAKDLGEVNLFLKIIGRTSSLKSIACALLAKFIHTTLIAAMV